MARTEPVDVQLPPAAIGAAIGCIVYQLDGTTVFSSFSTTGWYEAPASSRLWHKSNVTIPDAGGVIAIGSSTTEYSRGTVGAAVASQTDVAAILAAVGTNGVVLSTSTLQAIADTVLKRGAAHVDGGADRGSLYELIQIDTKAELDDDTLTLTIYQTDGTTIFGTRQVTFNNTGKPVASIE